MVPRLENVFNKSIYFPIPSHQNVCRDINQFPSLLDNSHQPLKHALLFITHLKINHQSNQQTIFWPCTLQVQPHFSAPLHSKTLWKSCKYSLSPFLQFSFSSQPTLMEFPSIPLPWKDPYQGHQWPTFCQRNGILCLHFTRHFDGTGHTWSIIW